ncbi:MAG: hypothetical protein MUD12_13965 [Spirochaetes bacterium]|jgi:hypothetical protein|nr:hypothetical protein [Spirochaetota bacterium]
MKRMIMGAIILMTIAVYAEDRAVTTGDPASGAEEKTFELSFGLDYYSKYLWRGTYYFGGDGAFLPFITFDFPKAGIKFNYFTELTEGYVIDGRKSQQKKDILHNTYLIYSYEIVNGRRRMNHLGYALQAADFNLEYSYKIKDTVTITPSVLYVWCFNSARARETKKIDCSSISPTLSVLLDFVPFVTPGASCTYDYYPAWDRGKDFYFQLFLKKEIELTRENKLTAGFTSGYYYQHSARTKEYSYSPDFNIWLVKKWPVKKGVSDMGPYVSWRFEKGPAFLESGLYWVIVPSRTWHKFQDVHRFYAKISAGLIF